jgi:hypothetical protein
VENKRGGNQVNEFCKCTRNATHNEEEISDGKNRDRDRDRGLVRDNEEEGKKQRS